MEEELFIENEKLKFLLAKQHRYIERQQKVIDDFRGDIEDLKTRIRHFLELDDEQVRQIRKDEYIISLEKGKNEAMNSLRKIQSINANLLRKQR